MEYYGCTYGKYLHMYVHTVIIMYIYTLCYKAPLWLVLKCTYIRTYVHTYVHMYVHFNTKVHMYIHTYVCAYTRIIGQHKSLTTSHTSMKRLSTQCTHVRTLLLIGQCKLCTHMYVRIYEHVRTIQTSPTVDTQVRRYVRICIYCIQCTHVCSMYIRTYVQTYCVGYIFSKL